jgi:hypothetical protein
LGASSHFFSILKHASVQGPWQNISEKVELKKSDSCPLWHVSGWAMMVPQQWPQNFNSRPTHYPQYSLQHFSIPSRSFISLQPFPLYSKNIFPLRYKPSFTFHKYISSPLQTFLYI